MPKSLMIRKKPTNVESKQKRPDSNSHHNSHWNSSKWSNLYSVPTTSAADMSSASLLLNLSTGCQSTPSIFLNGNKQYANDQSNGQHSIYMQNNNRPMHGYDAFALKQQQKTRFLLPPSNKQSNHIHLNGNSTSLSSHHNGSPLKSTFNNAEKSVDEHLNGQATTAKQQQDAAASFKKLLPANSLVARQQPAAKPSLIRFTNGSNGEQSKRQTKSAKVQTTKENSTSEQADGEANQKKTEPGKNAF